MAKQLKRVPPAVYKKWQQHCKTIQQVTTVDANESVADRLNRIKRARVDYNYFCEYYFEHYARQLQEDGTYTLSRNAKFHTTAANKIKKSKTIKAALKWARGHAKSTHLDIILPLWLKFQEIPQLHVMVLVGKSADSARTLLGDLQAELQYNRRLIHDFGDQHNHGSWEEGRFITKDGTAFFSLGRGQSPRGLRYKENRPDYIVIDDLDDDELVQNEARVRKLTEWVKEALFGALDGGRGRFIMVGNLIGKNSVLNNICNSKGVYVSQVNALDKEGNPVWADKWTKEELQEAADFMGYRAFQKEFMNNPITEGAVFKNDWIRWKPALPLKKYDAIVAYCDPSFKSSTKNDYKAIKVWGKAGTELHNLFAFVRQTTVSEMVRWFYDLHEKMTAESVICDYYIEANFLQDILLDEFELEGNLRGYQLPIRPDKRAKPNKFQRIEAISPLWERGFTWYNEKMKDDADMLAGLDQTLAFEKGTSAHDDGPDADEGAIYELQKRSRIESFTPRYGRRASSRNTW